MPNFDHTQITVEQVLVDFMDIDKETFALDMSTVQGPDFIVTGTFEWCDDDNSMMTVDFLRLIETGNAEPSIDNPVLSMDSEDYLVEYLERIYDTYRDDPPSRNSICTHLGMWFA